VSSLRLGIAGMGAAGQAFVAALRGQAGIEWVAMAEPADSLRRHWEQQECDTG
jgi:hypothetical protein